MRVIYTLLAGLCFLFLTSCSQIPNEINPTSSENESETTSPENTRQGGGEQAIPAKNLKENPNPHNHS